MASPILLGGARSASAASCGDKEGGLGHAEQQAQQHNQHKVVGVRGTDHPQCAEERAADKQRTPTTCVGQAAGDGPQDQGRDGEGAEREPRTSLVRTDRPGDPQWQGVDRDAGGGEVRKISNRQPDEGWGDEPVAACQLLPAVSRASQQQSER